MNEKKYIKYLASMLDEAMNEKTGSIKQEDKIFESNNKSFDQLELAFKRELPAFDDKSLLIPIKVFKDPGDIQPLGFPIPDECFRKATYDEVKFFGMNLAVDNREVEKAKYGGLMVADNLYLVNIDTSGAYYGGFENGRKRPAAQSSHLVDVYDPNNQEKVISNVTSDGILQINPSFLYQVSDMRCVIRTSIDSIRQKDSKAFAERILKSVREQYPESSATQQYYDALVISKQISNDSIDIRKLLPKPEVSQWRVYGFEKKRALEDEAIVKHIFFSYDNAEKSLQLLKKNYPSIDWAGPWKYVFKNKQWVCLDEQRANRISVKPSLIKKRILQLSDDPKNVIQRTRTMLDSEYRKERNQQRKKYGTYASQKGAAVGRFTQERDQADQLRKQIQAIKQRKNPSIDDIISYHSLSRQVSQIVLDVNNQQGEDDKFDEELVKFNTSCEKLAVEFKKAKDAGDDLKMKNISGEYDGINDEFYTEWYDATNNYFKQWKRFYLK